MTDDGKHPDQGDYDALPVAIKQYYSVRQWSVLSDSMKADIVRAETEPIL